MFLPATIPLLWPRPAKGPVLRHKASVRGAKSDRASDTRAQLQLAHSSTVGSTVGSTVDSANLHTD